MSAPLKKDGLKKETEIVTFGCRLNAYESQVMRDNAAAAGLEDAIIFNTCAVTAEAERQARQAIRRARRDNPEARIIVTGCAAQIDPARYAAMAEVDAVLGNREKMQPDIFSYAETEPVRVNDIMSVTETAGHLITGIEGRARAFVQIQNGCDHRCTFCIIPYGRGNSRSVSLGAVVDQVRTLVEQGTREVVLTGVDITSYGADLPGHPSLGQLVRRLLKLVPELPRLRISSIDSVEADDDLLRAIAEEERLMPHLHLSLQSGSDMILKRMKRRHSRRDSIEFCETVRRLRPETVFGADLIAGFPTETEDMFEDSLKLVADCGLTWLHVFPFSARPGTPAAKMPQHPKALCKDRAARLREAGSAAEARFLESVVGFERDGQGYSEQFAPVILDAPAAEGMLVTAEITGAAGRRLTGHIAEAAA
jgi:threonylcarbamoyladenosine tRNA methylthiotransferase MtaB